MAPHPDQETRRGHRFSEKEVCFASISPKISVDGGRLTSMRDLCESGFQIGVFNAVDVTALDGTPVWCGESAVNV